MSSRSSWRFAINSFFATCILNCVLKRISSKMFSALNKIKSASSPLFSIANSTSLDKTATAKSASSEASSILASAKARCDSNFFWFLAFLFSNTFSSNFILALAFFSLAANIFSSFFYIKFFFLFFKTHIFTILFNYY